MAHHDQIVDLEPTDVIAIRDRPHRPGCSLELSTGYVFHLSAQQETELLVMLMERQTGVSRGQAAYGLIGGVDGAAIPVLLHRRVKPRLVGDDSPIGGAA